MGSRVTVLVLLSLAVGCHQTVRVKRPDRAPASGSLRHIRELVSQAASRHGVPPDLVLGVIAVESSFRTDARSHVGAAGLMQLMPRTAASLARRLDWQEHDVDDPAFNIEAGTYYLAYLIKRFGSIELALAAYNAGPARIGRIVRSAGRLPAYSQRYVAAVQAARVRFADPAADRSEEAIDDAMDRGALRALLRERLAYGERPDEPLPATP